MEKDIVIEPLGNKRLKVEFAPVAKASKNKSYPSASDCCGKPLEQEKFCSICHAGEGKAHTSGKTQRKLFDKTTLVPSMMDKVVEQMAQMESAVITHFITERPEVLNDRVEKTMYITPGEKQIRQYAEFREVLKGRYAVGKVVLRNNESEVVFSVGDDNIIKAQFIVGIAQTYDKPDISPVDSVALNPVLVDLMKTVIAKKETSSYDFDTFVDTRQVIEQSIIEEFIKTGKVPEVKQVEMKQEEDEMEKLKALLVEV